MIKKKSLTSYLLYATGEIILVVLGILIALQINNWNEEKNVNRSIAEHLSILRKNLEEDQLQLAELKQIMEVNVYFADSLGLQFRMLIPVNTNTKKFLMRLVAEYEFSPNRNAMETITQSNEIPLLKPSLQKAILDYYSLVERTKSRENTSNVQIQTKYESYINENYPQVFQKDNGWEFINRVYANDPRPLIPIDPMKFINDSELEALVTARLYQSVNLRDFYGQLLESCTEILKEIE